MDRKEAGYDFEIEPEPEHSVEASDLRSTDRMEAYRSIDSFEAQIFLRLQFVMLETHGVSNNINHNCGIPIRRSYVTDFDCQ